jgi:hypothetical protein
MRKEKGRKIDAFVYIYTYTPPARHHRNVAIKMVEV